MSSSCHHKCPIQRGQNQVLISIMPISNDPIRISFGGIAPIAPSMCCAERCAKFVAHPVRKWRWEEQKTLVNLQRCWKHTKTSWQQCHLKISEMGWNISNIRRAPTSVLNLISQNQPRAGHKLWHSDRSHLLDLWFWSENGGFDPGNFKTQRSLYNYDKSFFVFFSMSFGRQNHAWKHIVKHDVKKTRRFAVVGNTCLSESVQPPITNRVPYRTRFQTSGPFGHVWDETIQFCSQILRAGKQCRWIGRHMLTQGSNKATSKTQASSHMILLHVLSHPSNIAGR